MILPTLKSHSRETDQPVLDRKMLASLALVCQTVLKVAGVWLFSNVELNSLNDWERVFGHQTVSDRFHMSRVVSSQPP